jgi:hypothetical protein
VPVLAVGSNPGDVMCWDWEKVGMAGPITVQQSRRSW